MPHFQGEYFRLNLVFEEFRVPLLMSELIFLPEIAFLPVFDFISDFRDLSDVILRERRVLYECPYR